MKRAEIIPTVKMCVMFQCVGHYVAFTYMWIKSVCDVFVKNHSVYFKNQKGK